MPVYYVLSAVPDANLEMVIDSSSVAASPDVVYPRFDIYSPGAALATDEKKIRVKLVASNTQSTSCEQVSAEMGKPFDGVAGQAAWIDGVRIVFEKVQFPQGRWRLCYSADGGQLWRSLKPVIDSNSQAGASTTAGSQAVPSTGQSSRTAGSASTTKAASTATPATATTTTTTRRPATTTSPAYNPSIITTALLPLDWRTPTTTTTTTSSGQEISTTQGLTTFQSSETFPTKSSTQVNGTTNQTGNGASEGNASDTRIVYRSEGNSILDTTVRPKPQGILSGTLRVVSELYFSLNLSMTNVQHWEVMVASRSNRVRASMETGLSRCLDVDEIQVTLLNIAVGPGRRLLSSRRLTTTGNWLVQYEVIVADRAADGSKLPLLVQHDSAKSLADAAGSKQDASRFAEVLVVESLAPVLVEELNKAREKARTEPFELTAGDLEALNETAVRTMSGSASVEDTSATGKIDFDRERQRAQYGVYSPDGAGENVDDGDDTIAVVVGVLCGVLAICVLVYIFLRYDQIRNKFGRVYAHGTDPNQKSMTGPKKQAQSQQRQSNESGLPPGWACALDEESGDKYFYHSESGVSQWEKPEASQSQTDVSAQVATPGQKAHWWQRKKKASPDAAATDEHNKSGNAGENVHGTVIGNQTPEDDEEPSRFASPKVNRNLESSFASPKASKNFESATRPPLRESARTVNDHPGSLEPTSGPANEIPRSKMEVGSNADKIAGGRKSQIQKKAEHDLNRLSFDELLVLMNGRGLDATDCMFKDDMIRKIEAHNAKFRNTSRTGQQVKRSASYYGATSPPASHGPGRQAPVDAERQMWAQRSGQMPRQKSWRERQPRHE